jgi:hypothetical protein
MVLGEPYAGGVAPQTPIGGRYAALQTSHVGVNFTEFPRCLHRFCLVKLEAATARQRWIY